MTLTPAKHPNAPVGTTSARPRQKAFKWQKVLLLALMILGIYAVFIEPYRIQVTHYAIQGAVATPLKIAHLTDLHTRGIGRRERRLLDVLEVEKPDVILITGDSVPRRNQYEAPRELYERLHAPLGVWFVRGNWENWEIFHHERAFYQDAGVHLLLNENAEMRPDVRILGVDDPYTGVARLDTAMAGVPQPRPWLVGVAVSLSRPPGNHIHHDSSLRLPPRARKPNGSRF